MNPDEQAGAIALLTSYVTLIYVKLVGLLSLGWLEIAYYPLLIFAVACVIVLIAGAIIGAFAALFEACRPCA